VNELQIQSNDLGWQFAELPECIPEIEKLLQSGMYVNGEYVREFEIEFAKFVESNFAVGVNSGTSALHNILATLGIGPGDEVIVPSLTFIATISAVLLTGATPVLVDVDEHGLLDYENLKTGLSRKTRAVIPVHLWGQAIKLEELRNFSGESIYVIEDCSQAHGARHDSAIAIGSVGIANAWSLYPGKNLGGIGEGGVITTQDSALFENFKEFRNWGSNTSYIHKNFGLNYRMDELNALVLRLKLAKLQEWNLRRLEISQKYRSDLTSIKVVNQESSFDVYHQFVVLHSKRDQLKEFLHDRGISSQIHYPIPNHKVKFLQSKCRMLKQYPNSEQLASNILSLPIHPGLSPNQIDEVVLAVNDFTKLF
jgi:dTDP-4-amino-4,6-dideoxygalactose transaminase